jgi:site-specific DNA recombinase
VYQIRAIGRDPALVAAVLAQVRRQTQEEIGRLERERAALVRQRRDDESQLRRLTKASTDPQRTSRMAEILDRSTATERRLSEITPELGHLQTDLPDEQEVAAALADFDTVWAALTPREQARVFELLIERVEYDGASGRLSITFHPTGIKTLAAESITRVEHAA